MALRMRTEVLVVGSGPGGAVTATVMAEAGRAVVICEEGKRYRPGHPENYTLAEMGEKYRNSGLTPALGPTKVTYIEGRCVGGASEINAALYHLPIPKTLDDWTERFQLEGLTYADLEPHFEAIESEVGAAPRKEGLSPASKALQTGADKLGWRHTEIQRFWRYEDKPAAKWGKRQSMAATLIPRAERAGAQLLTQTRITGLQLDGRRAVAATGTTVGVDGRTVPITIEFDRLVLACGAVQTPLLLRRSGVTRNIGNTLRMHPMIRIAARFPHRINEPDWGVPVQQVEQFKPDVTLGCSHSALPHVALWLAGDVPDKAQRLEEWERMAVFYAAVRGDALGTVRSLPFFSSPLVRYRLTKRDMALLGESLHHLSELVFAAGAEDVVNPIEGGSLVRHPRDLAPFRSGLPHGKVNVTAIHLFSSVPMGGDPAVSATCPWGRLYDLDNVLVNDASIIPDTPGVNPQATIMAVARRNALRCVEQGW